MVSTDLPGEKLSRRWGWGGEHGLPRTGTDSHGQGKSARASTSWFSVRGSPWLSVLVRVSVLFAPPTADASAPPARSS
jgi:hypothetical protein